VGPGLGERPRHPGESLLLGRMIERSALPVALPVLSGPPPNNALSGIAVIAHGAWFQAGLRWLVPVGPCLRQHKENEDKGSDED
jgi:hypothetical protein